MTIVAASNTQPALDSISEVYQAEFPNTKITIIYGASSKLYEQITQNAPFDLFFSADTKYPDSLYKRNKTLIRPKIYAIGQLAIWSKKIDPTVLQLNSLLYPQIHKIAIANPITSPYGEKALESLSFYNIKNKVESKFVYAENINQAAQFVSTGAAEIGIIALSTALSPNLQKEKGSFCIIPQKSHKPLYQACCVLQQTKNTTDAKQFFDYISSEKATSIYKHFGYLNP